MKLGPLASIPCVDIYKKHIAIKSSFRLRLHHSFILSDERFLQKDVGRCLGIYFLRFSLYIFFCHCSWEIADSLDRNLDTCLIQ